MRLFSQQELARVHKIAIGSKFSQEHLGWAKGSTRLADALAKLQ